MLSHEILLIQNHLEDQYIIAKANHIEHKGKFVLKTDSDKQT